jgi:hypothetical protein
MNVDFNYCVLICCPLYPYQYSSLLADVVCICSWWWQCVFMCVWCSNSIALVRVVCMLLCIFISVFFSSSVSASVSVCVSDVSAASPSRGRAACKFLLRSIVCSSFSCQLFAVIAPMFLPPSRYNLSLTNSTTYNSNNFLRRSTTNQTLR